jgi:amino acid transporter
MENPKKTVLKALFISVSIVIIIYVAVAVTVLGNAGFRNSKRERLRAR